MTDIGDDHAAELSVKGLFIRQSAQRINLTEVRLYAEQWKTEIPFAIIYAVKTYGVIKQIEVGNNIFTCEIYFRTTVFQMVASECANEEKIRIFGSKNNIEIFLQNIDDEIIINIEIAPKITKPNFYHAIRMIQINVSLTQSDGL